MVLAAPRVVFPRRRYLAKTRYFDVTAFVADPHKLLRTVMFCGFAGHVNCPLYLPSPGFRSVPINSVVDVT